MSNSSELDDAQHRVEHLLANDDGTDDVLTEPHGAAPTCARVGDAAIAVRSAPGRVGRHGELIASVRSGGTPAAAYAPGEP